MKYSLSGNLDWPNILIYVGIRCVTLLLFKCNLACHEKLAPRVGVIFVVLFNFTLSPAFER